jgi:hypothetical protein
MSDKQLKAQKGIVYCPVRKNYECVCQSSANYSTSVQMAECPSFSLNVKHMLALYVNFIVVFKFDLIV